jgi:hypothetical protein
MVIIGAVAITLVMGYVAFACGMFALFTFGGFDEVNIPAGICFTILFALDVGTWWWLVGQHINIKVSTN